MARKGPPVPFPEPDGYWDNARLSALVQTDAFRQAIAMAQQEADARRVLDAKVHLAAESLISDLKAQVHGELLKRTIRELEEPDA